jgi:hypothetical protein
MHNLIIVAAYTTSRVVAIVSKNLRFAGCVNNKQSDQNLALFAVTCDLLSCSHA